MSYQITQAAADDWREIAKLTLKNNGEDAMRRLYKALDKTMKHMTASDYYYWRYTMLFRQEIQIGHYDKFFILGVLRKDNPLLVFAILHQDTEVMQRLIKEKNFFGDHRTAGEMAEEARGTKITKEDYKRMTLHNDDD